MPDLNNVTNEEKGWTYKEVPIMMPKSAFLISDLTD